MQISELCIFINIFFSPHEVLQPFKVYNLQKLKQNTNKNISLTTFESQILINSSILPVAARVHPPSFPSCRDKQKPVMGTATACGAGLGGPGLQPLSGGGLAVQSLHLA